MKICDSFAKKKTEAETKMVTEEKLVFYVNGIKITEKFANTEVSWAWIYYTKPLYFITTPDYYTQNFEH